MKDEHNSAEDEVQEVDRREGVVHRGWRYKTQNVWYGCSMEMGR